MKLPDIKGRNKLRDIQICRLWLEGKYNQDELAQQFNMTHQGISRIIRNNKQLLQIDKEYEKTKRIRYLNRMLIKHDLVLGKKSSIDIVEQMRKEIEGDKPLVDNSKHIHMTSIKQFIEGIATSNRLPKDSLVDNNSR